MRSHPLRVGLLFAALAACAQAQAPMESIRWFDGERERVAWMSPAAIAEFRVPGAPRVLPVESATRALQTLDASSRASPVFHDDESGAGPRRALPGGIIVFFKREWSASDIERFLAREGLSGARRLNIAGNVYNVPTEPGMIALETANRIHASGEVISASPNWWQDRSLR